MLIHGKVCHLEEGSQWFLCRVVLVPVLDGILFLQTLNSSFVLPTKVKYFLILVLFPVSLISLRFCVDVVVAFGALSLSHFSLMCCRALNATPPPRAQTPMHGPITCGLERKKGDGELEFQKTPTLVGSVIVGVHSKPARDPWESWKNVSRMTGDPRWAGPPGCRPINARPPAMSTAPLGARAATRRWQWGSSRGAGGWL